MKYKMSQWATQLDEKIQIDQRGVGRPKRIEKHKNVKWLTMQKTYN